MAVGALECTWNEYMEWMDKTPFAPRPLINVFC